MGTGAIFLNAEWLEANKDAFKKAYDEMTNKPEDKGTHLLINFDDLQQDGFKITNETMTIRVVALDPNDDKKTLGYMTIDYDADFTIQEKITSWLLNRFAKMQAAAKLLLLRDEQHENA